MPEQIVSYHSNSIISKIYSLPSNNVLEFFDNGQVQKIYKWVDSKICGVYIEYYSNGEYKELCNFKDGSRHGQCCLFFENGNIKEKCCYVDNKLHGKSFEYTREGKIERYEIFNFGKNISPCYVYYKNENKINFMIYYNDSRDSGKIEHYNKNQQLVSISFFKNNRRDGQCLKYYTNGILSEKCFYKNDLLHGSIEKYYKDGECYFKGVYRNGKRNGFFTKIDDNMIERTRFKNDLRHGLYLLKDRQTKEQILSLYFQFDRLNGIQIFHFRNAKRFYRDDYFMLIESKKKNTCSVCWNLSRWKTPCGHSLCIDCAKKIENLECPMCRTPFMKKKNTIFNPFFNENFIKQY